MSAVTSIEWTDRSWNVLRGCSRVSEGCRHCYAERVAHRFSGPGKPFEGLTRRGPSGPQWTGKVVTVESALLEPLSWRKPQRVFVNSMSDLFHEDVALEFVDRVFAVMALAGHHTFQVLTKRADRMRAYLSNPDVGLRWLTSLSVASERVRDEWAYQEGDAVRWTRDGLPNVWLGVSVEDQQRANERIPLLLQTPAAVRFISAEPLLGPVNLNSIRWETEGSGGPAFVDVCGGTFCTLGGYGLKGPKLDWVIVGGESGHAARPMHPKWARSLRDQCSAAGVPFFFKQWGEWAPGECGDFTPTRAERTATFFDGKWDFGSLTPRQSEELHRDDEPDLYRYGKKRSGRLIDGVAWNEFPAVQP